MALNPIAFSEQVVKDFLRYQLTTYPLADVHLHTQMRSLLRLEETRATPLRQGPFVSLSRPFQTGASVAALVKEGVLHTGMNAVASFPGLRAHQERAIRAIHDGQTTLVATGTGSGKTEAFLYPIISRCLQLQDEKAPPGVVAVLIYPMNALAEDQLDRMRGLLAGRGIPFGMYVGKTPDNEASVRAERMPPGSGNADYHARQKQIRAQGHSTTLMPPEERASRDAMRASGGEPRILLTNVKQLELVLTRGKDAGLLANAPLEFLVFDEAHTFRGAQGAETACLIRRLRAFCGRSSEQVTCVATSATMADPVSGVQAGADFARRFFGVDATKVTLVGEIYQELQWPKARVVPPAPAGDVGALLEKLLRAVDAPDGEVAAAISACLLALGGAALPSTGDWQESLSTQLRGNEVLFQLAGLLRGPLAVDDACDKLGKAIGREVTREELMCWLALSVATARNGRDPVLRPVVHTFIRGVGGAVVTLSNERNEARLWLGGEDADEELGDAFRRFPLITCTTCGQHYFETQVQDFRLENGKKSAPEGGRRVGPARVWEHLAKELDGDRVLFVDRLVVQPDDDALAMDLMNDEQDAEPPSGHEFDHQRLLPMWICRACGSLHEDVGAACAACNAPDSLVAVQVVRSKKDQPGLLHSCVACQSPARRPGGGRYREPARAVRAVPVSDVHVLAQSMLHLSERKRLLVFADNRQDAAFQAGWMKDHARRFRLRALMAQALPAKGASIGDITKTLDDILAKDKELSRALIPEVWQVADLEDAGTTHAEERGFYLRVQVLREVALGVKQRVGLEPWGRLRVDYLGLAPTDEFFDTWAPKLGFSNAALCDGVAALLDHHRRKRQVTDSTKLFNKIWGDDAKEIQYGYFPAPAGGPTAVKLRRGDLDHRGRISQWLGSRPTQVWNAVGAWNLEGEAEEKFLEALWEYLTAKGLLIPTVLLGWKGGLPGTSGAYQLDSGKFLLVPAHGRYRCEKCRRISMRVGPTQTCMAWRCGGRVEEEHADADDFDLHVLDGNYPLLRVAEHSAQVPTDARERTENQFKGDTEALNTLVCTPTLELGVDIGALDAVLMRNVPPTAANYWQRAGRAGRRHRMAVDFTYAQDTSFDQAHFREPLKLLMGVVEPPRFNLRNALMIQKHVHATVLSALHALAGKAVSDSGLIAETVSQCFPGILNPYLFTPDGEVRDAPRDVSALGKVIQAHRAEILASVNAAFSQHWPTEDADSVTAKTLQGHVDGMSAALAALLLRLKRRLDWARGELARLSAVEAKKGALDAEDKAQRDRCTRMIDRLKGTARRSRAQAQGGPDDSDTMATLALEGFLPGYGLETGSIMGTCEPPRNHPLSDFQLARAPTIALREYVPGNAIYANGCRFVPRRFQLSAKDTLRFRVDAEKQVVQLVGDHSPSAPLATEELRAVPVCDVIMPSRSHISDEEEFRFQMAVATYAMDGGFQRGGQAYKAGEWDVHFRRGVRLTMVNVGPRSEVNDGSLGYHLCLACGQSASPFSSDTALKTFAEKHKERCGHVIQPTGFYAEVEVDTLEFKAMPDATQAHSLVEAIRQGASRVLDMEIEDLQVMGIGVPGSMETNVLLYDPMPGGSGLLAQLMERWQEVIPEATSLVTTCAAACERSCVDCLQTYRNRSYHKHLDRHVAASILPSMTVMGASYALPEKLPKTSHTAGQAQTKIEVPFKAFLMEAGLPEPSAQVKVTVDGSSTVADFYYPQPDEPALGICIFLDGLSDHIHGNAEQQKKDKFLRDLIQAAGHEVIVVPSSDLEDKTALVGHVVRIAKLLAGKERSAQVRTDTTWFDRAVAGKRAFPPLKLVRLPPSELGGIPIYDLQAAAGAFVGAKTPEAIGRARVEGIPATRPGVFVARVSGDSMDALAPNGAWCLWELLTAQGVGAAQQGDALLFRRDGGGDPELGEFTFKQLNERDGAPVLAPRSSNAGHKALPAEGSHPVARFIGVLAVS